MSQQGPKENFDQLIRDGYCLVEDILDDDILQRLRQVTDQLNCSTPKARKTAPNSAPR